MKEKSSSSVGRWMASAACSGVSAPSATRAMAPSSATPVRSSCRNGRPPRIIPRYTTPKTTRTVVVTAARSGERLADDLGDVARQPGGVADALELAARERLARGVGLAPAIEPARHARRDPRGEGVELDARLVA